MAEINDALLKSIVLSDIIQQREDQALRKVIENYIETLNFKPLDNLMISEGAWKHTANSNINPKLVFAHPDLLYHHPESSQYYRGIALLSQKQVSMLAAQVASWEDGSRKKSPKREACLRVARLYNAVISSIIEDSSDWTLENGYRNILATMGIRLDGMYRNRIGRIAEQLIKSRLTLWAQNKSLVVCQTDKGTFQLVGNAVMQYGTEPDIKFEKSGQTIATIEIKGGKDPAGALERLGAVQKSFDKTPPGCVNMLIAGVITPEMETRLKQMGVVKVYLLDHLAEDGEHWDDFVNEVFHHTVRII